jgi:hypothetical protein
MQRGLRTVMVPTQTPAGQRQLKKQSQLLWAFGW